MGGVHGCAQSHDRIGGCRLSLYRLLADNHSTVVLQRKQAAIETQIENKPADGRVACFFRSFVAHRIGTVQGPDLEWAGNHVYVRTPARNVWRAKLCPTAMPGRM